MIELEEYKSDILSPSEKQALRDAHISIPRFRHFVIWSGKSKREVLYWMLHEVERTLDSVPENQF